VAAQAELRSGARVALLGRDDAVRGQLHAALAEAGAEIVFEGELQAASVALLRDSAAATLIVNLEPGTEDGLERIDELLDDPGVQVVFNESEATRSLSGWDLARWARHLIAKVLGHGDATPPPPPGAEALPLRDLQPQPRVASVAPEVRAEDLADIADEARAVSAEVPQSLLPQGEAEVVAESGDAAEFNITLEREPSVEPEIALPAVVLERVVSEAADGDYGLDVEAIAIDLDPAVELDPGLRAPRRLGPDEPTVVLSRAELHAQLAVDEAALELPQPGRRLGPDEPTTVLDIADIEAGLAALESTPTELRVEPASEAYIEAADDAAVLDQELEGLLAMGDSELGALRRDDEPSLDLSQDDDVAALAAQLDALADSVPGAVGDDAGIDFDFRGGGQGDDAGLSLDLDFAEAPAASAAAVKPAGSTAGFGELSLLDMDEEPTAPAAATSEKASASFDFSGLSLSLEPIEGEQEAPAFAAPGEAPRVAPVEDTGGIPRVIVLGASIGGPDALRSFLGALPAGFPALFLLVQHLENGFFSRLAQQLQKASALKVRVADDDAGPAVTGEVIVIPSNARYGIDREGVISRSDYAEAPRYKPCIDDTFRAAADAFGADTLAIIFSGMAGDAVEGASYVTARGGEVWGQDPQSCVVSSMIDGANARGVLEFIGSPRELAERCIARFGRR
jgi:chemotaxis response regulator CheB